MSPSDSEHPSDSIGPSSSKPPLVLYFGAAMRGEFYTGLLNSGVALGLLRDTQIRRAVEPAEFDVVERMSFDEGADAIVQRIQRLSHDWQIETVININELLVPLWADVCARLGLPALSQAAVVRDKSEMRRRFTERIGAYATARSAAVNSVEQALAFAATTNYPVIVKPGNLWGSCFVSRCENADELVTAYEELVVNLPKFSVDRHVRGVPARILVEEFMTGTNHSVDCLVIAGRVWTTPVIDVVTGADLGLPDFHHFSRITSSRLTVVEQASMRELATKAVRALDIDLGAAHVEFIHNAVGSRLIEVAGRPGGYRATLLDKAFGINLIGGYRDVLRGVDPAIEPTRNEVAAVVTPYPQRAGELLAYRGLDRIRALPSVTEVAVSNHPGDSVGSRHEGFSAPMRIVMHAATAVEARHDLDIVTDLCADLFAVDTKIAST